MKLKFDRLIEARKGELIMQYYCVDEENELQVIESEKKLKGCYQSPKDAIEHVLDIEKRCLSNEEFQVRKRKEKVDKLQTMLDNYMNATLRF